MAALAVYYIKYAPRRGRRIISPEEEKIDRLCNFESFGTSRRPGSKFLTFRPEEDQALCSEIRSFLINSVSKTGGHLASNLGAVELTIALNKVFDPFKDRIVFDVGHQSYVHKLLTGRIDGFHTYGSMEGWRGFRDPQNLTQMRLWVGMPLTRFRRALGMARARTLMGEDYSVIAVIGDGALTGGLAYEGLNDAGQSREPLIVVLNDNGMSIQPNVGGISNFWRGND